MAMKNKTNIIRTINWNLWKFVGVFMPFVMSVQCFMHGKTFLAFFFFGIMCMDIASQKASDIDDAIWDAEKATREQMREDCEYRLKKQKQELAATGH